MISLSLADAASGEKSFCVFKHFFKIYYPGLLVWVSQGAFPDKKMDGSLPKGRFPVPKEVNRKKEDEEPVAACQPPPGRADRRPPPLSDRRSF
ncbi:neuronal regeneration-related protein [Perognathus longimembris pacificus]|uniref:neuronal regeneration-related protein n=1 Tax=Perognathus longimembris pacificus TaxID=214514 RepID=UPI0020186553|nr:neuronal regeneration-related protein [Perognathus longimembris pacificus]